MRERETTCPYPGYDKTGDYYTPRKAPRVRPEAEEYAMKNRGSLELFGSGEPRPVIQTPRASSRCQTEEGKQNYHLGRNGTVSGLLCDRPTPRPDDPAVPRVKPEAEDIANQHKGRSTNVLFKEYGNLPRSARPVPRVKHEAAETAELHSGNTMNRLMHDPKKIPLSARHQPRVKAEAQETANKEGLEMMKTLGDYGRPLSSRQAPRVKPEAEGIAIQDQGGRMNTILHGKSLGTSRPEPRVKPEAADMANLDKGGRMSRLMHEGDKARRSPRPPPRATSKSAKNIMRKSRGTMQTILSQSGHMSIVPVAGR
ncbi:hypothetical protein FSP39_023759 [Pinctada imbricata]|uniref:Uncharacterized protein n=1 Tax=Pinctada imbricata TaxID=66713 RepID=A0AA88Y879_PINIB|nr:hypothetical protein FSP39_023759 [Pinctada imbricata]